MAFLQIDNQPVIFGRISITRMSRVEQLVCLSMAADRLLSLKIYSFVFLYKYDFVFFIVIADIFPLVLKKSQKETSILVQQSCRGKEIIVDGQGNSNKLSKLESDLTGHWRSLFLHMEDMLALERNHLVSETYVLAASVRISI